MPAYKWNKGHQDSSVLTMGRRSVLASDHQAISPMPIVYFVDDEPLSLRSVSRLLQSAGWTTRMFDAPGAFLQSVRADMTGCVVLDVQMPGLNGLDLQQMLLAAGCHLPVIFLSGHADIPISVRAMKAGAVDFLVKPVGERDLLSAVERAMSRDVRERRERQGLAEITQRAALLTPREREVLSLVVTGLLNKQIAGLLGTTEKTIKVHRSRVMTKMRAQSVAELVRMASRIGVPLQITPKIELPEGLPPQP
jgi:FixJ family two-component response regulator